MSSGSFVVTGPWTGTRHVLLPRSSSHAYVLRRGRANADAVVLEEVLRLLRSSAARQVRRCRHHDEASRLREPDLDHVALDGLREADARVEALRDDVHEAVLGLDLDLHPRMPLEEPRQQAGEDERHRHGRDREPDAARDLSGPGGHRLQGLQRLIHCRARVLDQALPRVRERHGSRGPREERHAEARLELPDGLAQGGGGHAEIPRRGRKAAAPRDRDEGVQGVEGSERHREGFLHEQTAARPGSLRPEPRARP